MTTYHVYEILNEAKELEQIINWLHSAIDLHNWLYSDEFKSNDIAENSKELHLNKYLKTRLPEWLHSEIFDDKPSGDVIKQRLFIKHYETSKKLNDLKAIEFTL